MNQNTAKQQLSDEQKMDQLRANIGKIKLQIDYEHIFKLNDKKDPIYNIFLLGPSGAGKSTIANELIDVRIVFQSEDEETFNCSSKQNQQMQFKISEESVKSETDLPQEYKVNQYQIWDLPGYFDSKCQHKDLKNIVSSQSLIQKSEYSQILIVIPASQFFDYKLEKLIKILNNIDRNNCEISLSLVISMVNGQKLDYFLKQLNELLKSNVLQTGRELLLQIVVQNRVILFECPKQDHQNQNAYYFCQENVKQIKEKIFQKELFVKNNQIRLNPPDDIKITLQEIYQQSTKIERQQNHLTKLDLDLLRAIYDQQQFNKKPPLIEQLEKFEENMNSTIQKIQQVQNNILIIGETGAGKSTVCNILMDKDLIFKYEGLQFKPIEENGCLQFKISSDCTQSQTQVPQVEKISHEFQIWDVPGLLDTKSGLNDIITCLNIQLIVNHSSAVQIVLVIPEKEISDNKFKNVIEILNQFQDNNFTLTFLITHVDEYQKKQFFCQELEKLLILQETKLTNKSKQLLKRSLDNREERINILQQPIEIQQPIESQEVDLYQFDKDQIKLIQQNILRQNSFNKQYLVFWFTDVNKQEIKAQYKILEEKQDKVWIILFKVSVKSYFVQNSFLLPHDELNQQYICKLEKDYIKKYFQNEAQMNQLKQLIPDQLKFINQYDNHKNELKNIIEFLQIDQKFKTIRIFCSYMSISKLQQILQKYSQYDCVFIYSIVQFQVDQSFKYPGLSIFIKTKEFVVTSQNYVIINLKGNDGAPIHPRKAGQDQNNIKNGKNGIPGNNGQIGGNLYVDSQLYNNLDLLIIDVSGGNGSDGQDGGDGLDGQNGKDADPQPVNKKQDKYIVKQYLEKVIEEKDQENLKIEQDIKVQNNKPPFVKQQDIESQESYTFNKFNAVLLESKGEQGDSGGNSGAGGYGGLKGSKGQVTLKNFTNKLAKLIDQDGSNGTFGHDGIVGKGGLQGKNYKRAYWDAKYYERDISQAKIYFYIVGSLLSLGTLFVGLSLANFAQFCWKDGNWITNGDFIQENIRADDGKVNVRNSLIRKIERTDNIDISEFKAFVDNENEKKKSQLYQYIMN